MAELSSDTVLQRAPQINVELGPGTIIHVGGRHDTAGSHILPARQAFTAEATSRWGEWYMLTFTSLDGELLDRWIVVSRPPAELRGMKTLGSATLLAGLDVSGESSPRVDSPGTRIEIAPS